MVTSPKDKTTGKQDALTAAREKAKQGQTVSQETTEIRQAYINEVQFSGRLGRDVEFQFTPTGKEMVKSSLAVFNPGNKEQDTMWFDLVLWVNDEPTEKGPATRDLAETFLVMEKGEAVVAKGRLTMRSFKDKQGDAHTVYTITLSDIG